MSAPLFSLCDRVTLAEFGIKSLDWLFQRGRSDPQAVDFGFVYLMGCQGNIKIGKSIIPSARRDSCQTGNPFAVRVLKRWRVSSMMNAESALKYMLLYNYRVRGEWCSPPPEIRRLILSVVDLESLIYKGVDAERESLPPAKPIPSDFPTSDRCWAVVSPRSHFHVIFRYDAEVLTLCGKEMTPENYWRIQGKHINRPKFCPFCESHFELFTKVKLNDGGWAWDGLRCGIDYRQERGLPKSSLLPYIKGCFDLVDSSAFRDEQDQIICPFEGVDLVIGNQTKEQWAAELASFSSPLTSEGS